jgi:hypothetical protein
VDEKGGVTARSRSSGRVGDTSRAQPTATHHQPKESTVSSATAPAAPPLATPGELRLLNILNAGARSWRRINPAHITIGDTIVHIDRGRVVCTAPVTAIEESTRPGATTIRFADDQAASYTTGHSVVVGRRRQRNRDRAATAPTNERCLVCDQQLTTSELARVLVLNEPVAHRGHLIHILEPHQTHADGR